MPDHHPLSWPSGYPRTKRRRSSQFKTPFASARDGLLDELRLMGAKNTIISTNIETYMRGSTQVPYANQANPDDPGVAVYFEYEGDQRVLACDRWKKVEANMQALRKTVQALRGLGRWGVSDMLRRIFTGFKALPETTSGKAWWDILGIHKDADVNLVRHAYRRRARNRHPDQGGSPAAWHELQVAYAQALAATD